MFGQIVDFGPYSQNWNHTTYIFGFRGVDVVKTRHFNDRRVRVGQVELHVHIVILWHDDWMSCFDEFMSFNTTNDWFAFLNKLSSLWSVENIILYLDFQIGHNNAPWIESLIQLSQNIRSHSFPRVKVWILLSVKLHQTHIQIGVFVRKSWYCRAVGRNPELIERKSFLHGWLNDMHDEILFNQFVFCTAKLRFTKPIYLE